MHLYLVILMDVVIPSPSALGHAGQLPCEFSDPLLKTKSGVAVQYTSDEMKRRARRKTELSGLIRNADLKGTAKVTLLIGTSGEVVCLKVAATHPLVKVSVERALSSWTFKQEHMNGEPVAYLGRLEFFLCNINCGASGNSMTLLK
jgi:hypothetical protein